MAILSIVLIVYGAILLFSGFIRNSFMIKMVRLKFGKKLTDKAAVNIMYGFGVVMIIAGIVILVIF